MNNFPFHSSTEQELQLETTWLDTLASTFTVTSIDFETNKAGRPTEIGLTQTNLSTGAIEKGLWMMLDGSSGCMQLNYPNLREFLLKTILLAHNKATEERCLWIGLIIPPPARLWLDSLNIARALLPQLGSYALSEIVDTLKIDVAAALTPAWPEAQLLRPHHALWDSAATGLVLHRLLQHHPHLTLRQLATLMPRTADRPRTTPHQTSDQWQDPR